MMNPRDRYLTTERSDGDGDRVAIGNYVADVEIRDADAYEDELADELLAVMSFFAVSPFSPVVLDIVTEVIVMFCPDPMGVLRRRLLD